MAGFLYHFLRTSFHSPWKSWYKAEGSERSWGSFLTESKKDLVRPPSTERAALEPRDYEWNRETNLWLCLPRSFQALGKSCSTSLILDMSDPMKSWDIDKAMEMGKQVGPKEERKRQPLWGHKRPIPLEVSRKISGHLPGWVKPC